MTILEDRLSILDSLVLESGGHREQQNAFCVMEAVAYIAGEEWTDTPECASGVIGAFMRTWNEDLDDAGRQKLKPYITRLVGSKASKKIESQRAWLCTDWLIHHQAPAWLDLAGLHEQAEALRGLPPILTTRLATKHQPTLDEVKSKAYAAWAAAGDAARDAARDAAWAAAGAAARDAAGNAAGDAAWAAAGNAAGDAAWAAAGDAAGAAARAAAGAKLQPTVVSLQQSAFDLLDAMLDLRD